MTIVLVILGILSAIAVGATVRALRTDGYHQVPTDWSRLP